jgi:hypothetical protein
MFNEVKVGQKLCGKVVEGRPDNKTGRPKLALSRKAVIKSQGLVAVLEAEERAERGAPVDS